MRSGGRNACRDAFRRLYRHGECRTVAARIDGGHRGQVELPDPLFGQTEAYDATASADHQGHLFDGHICRGKDQIAFVLSVFIVNQQDSAGLGGGFLRLVRPVRQPCRNGIIDFLVP